MPHSSSFTRVSARKSMNEGDFVVVRPHLRLVRRNGKSGQIAADNLTRTMSLTSRRRSDDPDRCHQSQIGGLFGRYGSSDLVVMLALLRLFETVVEVLSPGSARLAVMERATVEALADAER